eukprot:1647167-Prymnesium_polylepis.1
MTGGFEATAVGTARTGAVFLSMATRHLCKRSSHHAITTRPDFTTDWLFRFVMISLLIGHGESGVFTFVARVAARALRGLAGPLWASTPRPNVAGARTLRGVLSARVVPSAGVVRSSLTTTTHTCLSSGLERVYEY